MLLPAEWLRDFIDLKESTEELADILTMAGLEIEGVEGPESNPVFDVNITPNRPDCLSVAGIARELSTATGRQFNCEPARSRDDFMADIQVEIKSPLCSRYTGRVIRDVKLSDSPAWLKKRLELSGIRPINSIVDVTNYVMIELGHPLHAFDLDRLNGKKITIDTPEKPIQFRTLDGIDRNISEDVLLIRDSNEPVAIAGVMGGLDSEVNEDTLNIFLESAFFNPQSVRRTSKALGLRTESSFRFERGTDIEGLTLSLDRAASLITEICGGSVSGMIDIYPSIQKPLNIRLRPGRIERLLGIKVSREEVISILESLGFSLHSPENSGFIASVPSHRVDIFNETDLIEEVGRHYGYNRIPSHIPAAPIVSPSQVRSALTINRIKGIMKSSGFNEAINYSFMNPDMIDGLKIGESDERRKTISLLNPLRKEDSSLRTTLLPSFIDNLLNNLNQGTREIALFEISKVFIRRGGKLPVEKTMLGAVYMYSRGQRLWEEETETYYLLKGTLEKVFHEMKSRPPLFKKSTEPFMHPGKSSDIYLEGSKIGFAGIISPEIKNTLNLKNIKPDIGIVEIEIDSAVKYHDAEVRFTSLPRYPSIQRDIAMLLDDTIASEDVLKLIREFPSDLIVDSWVFDHYQGKNLPAGKRSHGFSVLYRDEERTLTDDEVEPLHNQLIENLIYKTGGKVRD